MTAYVDALRAAEDHCGTCAGMVEEMLAVVDAVEGHSAGEQGWHGAGGGGGWTCFWVGCEGCMDCHGSLIRHVNSLDVECTLGDRCRWSIEPPATLLLPAGTDAEQAWLVEHHQGVGACVVLLDDVACPVCGASY